MRQAFTVPWITFCCRSLLSVAVTAILVFSVFALLKVSSQNAAVFFCPGYPGDFPKGGSATV